MVYISIDEINVPLGNFNFIYDATQNEGLFKKFYDAEKNLKVDYIDFAHKIRIAYEAFALEEEALKRRRIKDYENLSLNEIKKLISLEIKKPASIVNYKNIIIDLCRGREKSFSNMLYKYSFVKNPDNEDEVRIKLKKYIRFLYSFGSESSHENVSLRKEYIPNKYNCLKVSSSFHDFLCVYYNINKKYDSTLIPIRDYIPIPKSIVEKMKLSLDTGKKLFVSIIDGRVKYFILSSDIDGISYGQRRDIDTINKLWEDNLDDPSNIIRQTENIIGSNGDYKFQVYSLPNRPYKLTKSLLDNMTISDKLDIIYGLCKGVQSIHNYETPMYHRNISPNTFYIFKIREKYKPLLAKFDCTKDTANNQFTVFNNVEKRIQDQNTNKFFAPEVLNLEVGKSIDWRKADIYSLAKTILYILSGKNLEWEEYEEYLESCDISDEIKTILIKMLSFEPNDRPEVEELIEVL